MVRSVFLSVRDRRGCSVNQEEPELEDEQAAFIHWLSPTSIRAATARGPQHYWQNQLPSSRSKVRLFQLMVRSVFLSVRDRRGCSVNQEEPELEDEQAAFIHRRSSTATRACVTGLDTTHARHSFHLPGGHYHDWVA